MGTREDNRAGAVEGDSGVVASTASLRAAFSVEREEVPQRRLTLVRIRRKLRTGGFGGERVSLTHPQRG